MDWKMQLNQLIELIFFIPKRDILKAEAYLEKTTKLFIIKKSCIFWRTSNHSKKHHLKPNIKMKTIINYKEICRSDADDCCEPIWWDGSRSLLFLVIELPKILELDCCSILHLPDPLILALKLGHLRLDGWIHLLISFLDVHLWFQVGSLQGAVVFLPHWKIKKALKWTPLL